ncbi:MAG: B12-binding domain-containing radical SAM protein [candidate division Zixibacteria bacterium]|nr:B12-binding domain-containing radical SAM protein [candidate division Zixibacteria bacterium]
MTSIQVDLVSVPANFGHGANDGAYYPCGILSIGTFLKKLFPESNIRIIDLHHDQDYVPSAEIVGIAASSTLNYSNVLEIAQKAKNNNSIVVLGGPHATHLANQILLKRNGLIDYVIRGKGEIPFGELIKAIQRNSGFEEIPNLSWISDNGTPIHNPVSLHQWEYDAFVPFDFSLLNTDISDYTHIFNKNINSDIDTAFVVFTHFGCKYQNIMKRRHGNNSCISGWCSFCSLNDNSYSRSGTDIVNDIKYLISYHNIPFGSRILLKCYGDNVGYHKQMLDDLYSALHCNELLSNYRIEWTFYVQSSHMTEDLAIKLQKVGGKNIFIGFDSADDKIQKYNGLGSTLKSHKKAANICKDFDFKLQAAFMLGCAGETLDSLGKNIRFAEELSEMRILERINTAIVVIMPGAPNYSLLCSKENWIMELDELPTEKLQWYWVKHFCPELGNSPTQGLDVLRKVANRLDCLSPGPHSSMGYISNRMIKSEES